MATRPGVSVCVVLFFVAKIAEEQLEHFVILERRLRDQIRIRLAVVARARLNRAEIGRSIQHAANPLDAALVHRTPEQNLLAADLPLPSH